MHSTSIENEIVFTTQYFKELPNGDRESHGGGKIHDTKEDAIETARQKIERDSYLGCDILKEEQDEHGNLFPPNDAGNPVVVYTIEPDKILGISELDGMACILDLEDQRNSVKDFIAHAIQTDTDMEVKDISFYNEASGGGMYDCTIFTANCKVTLEYTFIEFEIDAWFSLNSARIDEDGRDYLLDSFEVVCEEYKVI